MIPKVIHFVWLGGAPKPPVVLKCVESWRRMCPGWEIREWGDESLVGLDNRYLREAVAHRKWAFAADYLRLKILNDYGGFYLDSDLELLKPIDEFRKYDFATGFIDRPPNVFLNMCFLGAAKGNGRIAEMLDEYGRIPFVGADGELDQTPNVVRFARYFASRGFDFSDAHATVELSLTERIFPVEWFNSREGYAFHHYAASWLDDWARKVWLRCGRWKLVRFKRRLEATSPAPALMKDEKAVFTLRLGGRKRIVLLRGAAAALGLSGKKKRKSDVEEVGDGR